MRWASFTAYQLASSAFSSSSLQRTSLVPQSLFAPNILILSSSPEMLIAGGTTHSLAWIGCMLLTGRTRSCFVPSTSPTPAPIMNHLMSSFTPPLCTTSIYTIVPGPRLILHHPMMFPGISSFQLFPHSTILSLTPITSHLYKLLIEHL